MSRGRSGWTTTRQVGCHAPIFAALGDKTRLTLLARLCDAQSRSISQLTKGSTVTRQAITKHLRVLEEARLVRAKTVGRECLYELEPKTLEEAQNYLSRVSRQWDKALARLKAFVEKED